MCPVRVERHAVADFYGIRRTRAVTWSNSFPRPSASTGPRRPAHRSLSRSDAGRQARGEIKHAFNSDPSKHPLRILIATDAAREGLNLQGTCWNLFPFRRAVESRAGWNSATAASIRKGQQHEVFCHYFVYRQRAEDKVLQVLVRKTERIKRELGCLNQVLDDRLASALRGGIRHSDAARMAENLDAADLDAEQKETLSRG